MDSTRNKSLQAQIVEIESKLREIFVTRPLAWWSEARVKMQDLPKTNFDLGCMFAEQGKWFDAVLRFRLTLWLQPQYPQAQYNLGCCYFRLGQLPKAKMAFKAAIKQNPANQEAIFMLAAIDADALPAGQRPQHMPQAMVTQFFTSVAPDYEAMELRNQYHGGAMVYEQVKSQLKVPSPVIVDLACGTGIAALPWRAQAKTIIGVDYTPAMLAKAEVAALNDKKTYDRTVAADISNLPDTIEANSADLVLAVNALQFVGDLRGVFTGAARVLKSGGLFALTVEPYGGQGFGLKKETGRFGHSNAYVKHMASSIGFSPVSEAPIALYPNTKAELLVFSKGSI